MTVSFECNGHGTPTPDPITVYYGQPYGELPEISEDGYTFGGWYLDQACTVGNEVDEETIVVTMADHTLYAK